MPKFNFEGAATKIGKFLSSEVATKAHVTANPLKYGLAPKGTKKAAATAAYRSAIAKRQMEIGRRAITAGGVGIGLMGGSAIGSNKKSYYNPMPTQKGSGRYA